jgi:very-short-patch-repair endonuclease
MRLRLTAFARALRRQETNAEQRLWKELRNRQLDGWKFKRQVPHGRYVLDFFCMDASLIVEVDGYQHFEERAAHDVERTRYLEAEALRVLRLGNSDVLDNIDGSLEAIYLALGHGPAPSPGAARRPLPKGRGEGSASGEGEAPK